MKLWGENAEKIWGSHGLRRCQNRGEKTTKKKRRREIWGGVGRWRCWYVWVDVWTEKNEEKKKKPLMLTCDFFFSNSHNVDMNLIVRQEYGLPKTILSQ